MASACPGLGGGLAPLGPLAGAGGGALFDSQIIEPRVACTAPLPLSAWLGWVSRRASSFPSGKWGEWISYTEGGCGDGGCRWEQHVGPEVRVAPE